MLCNYNGPMEMYHACKGTYLNQAIWIVLARTFWLLNSSIPGCGCSQCPPPHPFVVKTGERHKQHEKVTRKAPSLPAKYPCSGDNMPSSEENYQALRGTSCTNHFSKTPRVTSPSSEIPWKSGGLGAVSWPLSTTNKCFVTALIAKKSQAGPSTSISHPVICRGLFEF